MTAQIPLKRIAFLCLLAAATVQAAKIDGSVTFAGGPGGLFGQWEIVYNSTDPAIQLRSIRITLPSTYGFDTQSGNGFDTQSGGWGVPRSQDFQIVSGGAGVSALTPQTVTGRDGANVLLIDFAGFVPGAGPFRFDLDVDGALAQLGNCEPGPPGYACNAANGEKTLDAATVGSDEIDGTLAYLIFGGSIYNPFAVQTTLRLTNEGTAVGPYTTEAVIPEPSTYALVGFGLAGLGFLRRRLK